MRWVGVLGCAVLAACRFDVPQVPDALVVVDASPPGDAPVDIGFTNPAAPLKANASNVEVGPADLSCLGTPASDPATTIVVTLATTVRDFQNAATVSNAMVTAFRNVDIGQPFDTKTADAAGMVSIAIPVGTRRFGFKMVDSSSLDTLLLNHTVAPGTANQTLASIATVSRTTATVLPALIAKNRTPGTGILLGTMRDCQGREISNFIATVSSTQGSVTHLRGADTYYFDPTAGLPVRHNQRGSASSDGQFMVIDLEVASTAYVQVWGYPTEADLAASRLKLIAELQAPVIADTAITGSYAPLRTGP